MTGGAWWSLVEPCRACNNIAECLHRLISRKFFVIFFCNVGTGEIKIITLGSYSYSHLQSITDWLWLWLYMAQFLDDLIYQRYLDMWEFPSNPLVL